MSFFSSTNEQRFHHNIYLVTSDQPHRISKNPELIPARYYTLFKMTLAKSKDNSGLGRAIMNARFGRGGAATRGRAGHSRRKNGDGSERVCISLLLTHTGFRCLNEVWLTDLWLVVYDREERSWLG